MPKGGRAGRTNTMYKEVSTSKTSLSNRTVTEGERIETKLERIKNNNEPTTDGAPLIYTAKGDGVLPGYNIRTDKWDIALEAMDKIHKTDIAKRADMKVIKNDKKGAGEVGGTESSEGTN